MAFRVEELNARVSTYPNFVGKYIAACNDDDIYFLGKTGKKLCNEIWKYNLSSLLWRKLKIRNMPLNVFSSIGLRRNAIHVLGTYAFGLSWYKCNLNEPDLEFHIINTFGNVPKFKLIRDTFSNDCYYSIGECSGKTEMYKLNLKTLVWESFAVPPLLIVLTSYGLTAVGDKIFIVGWIHIRLRVKYNLLIFSFDTENNVWEIIKTKPDINGVYPTLRYYHSVVSFDTKILIVGGLSIFGATQSSVLELDTITFSLRDVKSLRLHFPVHSHTSVVTPSGRMYTFGGFTDRMKHPNDIRFQSAWLTQPTLFHRAWGVSIQTYGVDALKELLPGILKNKIDLE